MPIRVCPAAAISSPADPPSMIRISAVLTSRMIFALSIVSASWPDSADSRKNGSSDSPVASALKFDSTSARSEEHTSELQSLMRISYAVFCLKQKHLEHTDIKYLH